MKQTYFSLLIIILFYLPGMVDNPLLAAAQPTVAASNIVFTNITNTTANISWTNGNGTGRIVLIQEKEDFIPFFFPQDGKTFSANSTYKLGSNVGYKMFAIYIGSGSSVNVTGLFNGTRYFITVLEYNGVGTDINYLQSPFPNRSFMTSGPVEPTVPSSGISFSNVTNNTMDIGWTNGNGERRIVLIQEKIDLVSFFFPKDGKQYSANATFKKGTNVGYNMFAVYDGTGNSVSVDGLFNGTTYYVTVLDYNGTDIETNYILSPFPKGVVTTPGPTEPTIRPSQVSFSEKTETSVKVKWVNGNGERRIVLVRAKASTFDYFSPEDGKSYTANSTFGQGQYTGWVDTQDKRHYIVYNGSGNEFTLTGLQPFTEYYFSIVEYNGTGATANYNRAIQTPSPVVKTLAPEPTVNATNLNFSNVTGNSMQVNWVNGNGSQRLLMVSTNPITNAYFPVDGRDYVANGVYGSGASLGFQVFAAYKGSGSSAMISGLSTGTRYYVAVVEFNGTGTEINYLSTGYLTGSRLTEGPQKPTVNATNLSFTDVSNTSMQVDWTNGNGAQRVVVASTNPINLAYFTNDGSDYTGNSSFGSGSYLGPNTYAMYKGTGSSVTLTGLSPGTVYYIAVVEFNGTGSLTKYLTTGFLTGSQLTTGAVRPTVNATNLSFSNVTNSSMQVSWTNGNGAQRIVVASTNPINLAYFTNDGADYTGNSNFGSGSYLGPNTFAMYEGTGSTVTFTGLSSGTLYYVAVVEFNGTGPETKYLRSGFLNGTQLTNGATRPTVNATNLMFNGIANNTMGVSWTNGNGAQRVVVVSTGPFNMAYFTNDGGDYTANNSFGSGTNLGSNTFVVYEGTGSSVNITGLSSGTTYYVGIVEFNGTAGETKYLRTGFLQGTQLTTGAIRPAVNASNILFSNITGTGVKVDWTNGNGARRLVIASNYPLQEPFLPKDGVDYIANANFFSGSHLGLNAYIMYKGTGSTVTITGLSPSTTYYIGVIEMNGEGNEIKYLKANFVRGTITTTSGATTSTSSAIANFTSTFSNQDASNLEEPIILNNYLEVYPNPASSYVNISLQLAEAVGSEMHIYSTQGKLIMVKQYTGNFQETLELDKLDKGIYIIRLVTETDHQVTKQLIIQ